MSVPVAEIVVVVVVVVVVAAAAVAAAAAAAAAFEDLHEVDFQIAVVDSLPMVRTNDL